MSVSADEPSASDTCVNTNFVSNVDLDDQKLVFTAFSWNYDIINVDKDSALDSFGNYNLDTIHFDNHNLTDKTLTPSLTSLCSKMRGPLPLSANCSKNDRCFRGSVGPRSMTCSTSVDGTSGHCGKLPDSSTRYIEVRKRKCATSDEGDGHYHRPTSWGISRGVSLPGVSVTKELLESHIDPHTNTDHTTQFKTINPDDPEYPVFIASTTTFILSKDFLIMRRDNLVNFITTDFKMLTEFGKSLVTKKRFPFNKLQLESINVGDTCTIPDGNHHIFHLTVKRFLNDKINLKNVQTAFKSFKTLLLDLNIKQFSISRHQNDIFDISWDSIESIIKEVFKGHEFTITICSGEVKSASPQERPSIVREYHESVVGGHQGVNKTFRRLREDFYWEGIKVDVESFIRTCPSCQTNKINAPKTKQPMTITDTPTEAFERVQMDIVGPLPITSKGNQYLITLQDNLSKYSDAIPVPKIDSITVAMALAEHFISRFGCPKAIHTDQGSNFTSQIMRNFCSIFKIKQIKSTAFHPQSLGSLERAHRVFVEYLKHYCTNTDWDDWIRFAMFSYNTSIHEATGFSPHELIFGRKAKIPSEFVNEQVPATYIKYFDDLVYRLTTTQSTAACNINIAKTRSKFYYDGRSNPKSFKIGDLVYLLKEPTISKFDQVWTGPYEIIKLFGDKNAEIQLSKNRTKIVHEDKLKLAHIRPDLVPIKPAE